MLLNVSSYLIDLSGNGRMVIILHRQIIITEFFVFKLGRYRPQCVDGKRGSL
jgi:hypothetical protein